MKLKRLFLGMSLLAIAGLWTGCSNDNEIINTSNEERAISFRVQGGMPELRATGTTLPFVNAFVVNAYGDVSSGTIGPIMDAVTVYRVEGTGNIFDYNPKAYYKDGDTEVDFAAYSPVSTKIDPGLKGNVDNRIAYTVDSPDGTSNTVQEDLLVAYTNQTDLLGTPVPLAFKHALSRVYVKAVSTLTSDVIITSLKLVNLYESGELVINADIEDAYAASPADFADYKTLWTPTGTQNKTYSYALPESGVSVPAGTSTVYVVSKEQGMMVLPQTTLNVGDDAIVDPDDFYVEVGYTIANVPDVITVPFKDLYGIAPDADQGLTFEFGRQYALNINFAGSPLIEITFSVTVEDWNTPISDVPLP